MLKKGIKLGLKKEGLREDSPLIKASTKVLDLGPTPPFHNFEVQKGKLTDPFIFNPASAFWFMVGDKCGTQGYFERADRIKTAVKWGQLKLFSSELQFLNKYWNPEEVPSPQFVYVGGAPGNHVNILSKMFPQITFHLYDKQPFDNRLESLSNVNLYKKYFEEEDIVKFSDRDDVFFISDIRTLTYTKGIKNDEEIQRKNTEITKQDMALQMEWVQRIKPVKALLKFVLPYLYKWNKETTLEYMDGDLYKQCWAGQTSTETRMVPDMSLTTRSWDIKFYEEAMFYHNNVIRENITFINPLTNKNEPISEELGLLQDYDSVLFVTIVKEYLQKFNSDDSPASVLAMCEVIIKDISNNRVNITGLRSGENNPAVLYAIQKAMKEMGDENEE